ncbi:MAG TPA: helix-turn-helix transcriptional regulator [Spirochaetia bacterium]
MLVAVKTPRIRVHISGQGAKAVVKALRQIYDSVEVTDDDATVDVTTTSWWKKMEAIAHPGMALWTYRDNAGLTLERLSRMCGIAKSHLSAMENGKRAIGTRTARKLATALNVDYRMFL